MRILRAKDISIKKAYKPSYSDIKHLNKKQSHLKLSGDGVFHTIQGEGDSLGTPMTFIRTHFCNLQCSWCDTWYTWHTDAKEFYKEPYDVMIDDLHSKIRNAQLEKQISKENHIYRIAFTGGEPLLQQDKIEAFLRKYPQYYCEIETNGTIIPSPFLVSLNTKLKVKFNCSPKLENSGNLKQNYLKPKVIKTISSNPFNIFKFVCSNKEDIDEALGTYGKYIPRNRISILSEGVTKEENSNNYKKMINYIIELGLTTHPRLQNICFDGSRRAV